MIYLVSYLLASLASSPALAFNNHARFYDATTADQFRQGLDNWGTEGLQAEGRSQMMKTSMNGITRVVRPMN